MRYFNWTWLLFLMLKCCVICLQADEERAEKVFFQDGDRIVVIGDSITVQGYYVYYIENFIRTRFPKWKIIVRNAGINGHTAKMGMPYMDNDVLIWKPTVAIVNWGMNDGRRNGGAEYYKTGIVPYIDKLIKSKLRIALCSNSPLDIGDPPGKYTNYNKNFLEMSKFAKDLAARRGIIFVDQFNFCHPLWGWNRTLKHPVPVSDQTLVTYPSDAVHARAPGQLTMAYIILKTLSAPSEVSFASINTKTGKAKTRRCVISEFKKFNEGKSISFVRADESSPCWIDDKGALAFTLVPFNKELNRMILKIYGFAEGKYRVEIEGFIHGEYTAKELKNGINLSENRKSPVFEPGRKMARLIIQKRILVSRLRNQTMLYTPPKWFKITDLDGKKREEFEKRVPMIKKADEAIAGVAFPKPLKYLITRISE